MAISTTGTVLTITGDGINGSPVTVEIKSFPDLGAAPAAIDITTLADEEQNFIPGKKGRAAMEFVANYEENLFKDLQDAEKTELSYAVSVGSKKYTFAGQHSVVIAAGALNAAVDMKITVFPNGPMTSAATA